MEAIEILEFITPVINHGYGDGSGSGSGYGYGSGSGYGLKRLNNKNVYRIDGVETIITSVRKNVAKGFIVKRDLTLVPCFVVKQGEHFAHGKSLRKAMDDLREKLFEDMSQEERIDLFIEEFELDKKYPAMKYFDWHNKLTGSCDMGRRAFASDNDIDLESDTYSVKEFIEKTKNDYGGSVIKALENRLKNCKNYF